MAFASGFASDEHVDWSSAYDSDEKIEIPDVQGWRILVMPLKVKNKSSGGVILPDSTLDKEQLVVSVGRVVDVGPLAYKNREDMKVDGEVVPWCKEGDLVGYGKYAGKRFIFKGYPFVVLNDDEVIMTYPQSAEEDVSLEG